jgi:hypothetical protein
MTTALGDRSKTGVLLAEQLGTSNEPVNTAYITNIVPPPTAVTGNLDDVCLVGNTTSTDINITDPSQLNTKRINSPGDEIHIRGKVGLGTDPADPLVEDVEIDGNVQIDTSGLGKIVFYNKSAGHENGEFDADNDGVNGGQLVMKTKEDGGSVQTRMVIREDGKVGISNINPTELLTIGGVNTKIHFDSNVLISSSGNRVAIGDEAGLTGQDINTVALGNSAGRTGQLERATAVGHETGYDGQKKWATAIGNSAGRTSQGEEAVAIGRQAGRSNQGNGSVAVGVNAGFDGQLLDAISIGRQAGETTQGNFSIALGYQAGRTSQLTNSVAIGNQAGTTNQRISAVAIGDQAGNATQRNYTVAIGYFAGNSNQLEGAVAIGEEAGANTQGGDCIAIGTEAGRNNQQTDAVAIGYQAGNGNQQPSAVAIGENAGTTTQGVNAVAIGKLAGRDNQQTNAVAIGNQAGRISQQPDAIAIGPNAGYDTQGSNSIAIGNLAGQTNQHDNSIVLNASGSALPTLATNSFYVKSLRNILNLNSLTYDSVNGEITYAPSNQVQVQEYDIDTVFTPIAVTKPFVQFISSTGVPFSFTQAIILPDASASNYGLHYDISYLSNNNLPPSSVFNLQLNYTYHQIVGSSTVAFVSPPYQFQNEDATPGSYTYPTGGRFQVVKDYANNRYLWRLVLTCNNYN